MLCTWETKWTLGIPDNNCHGSDPVWIWKTVRVRNVKFATYLKFATCGNTNKINELR